MSTRPEDGEPYVRYSFVEREEIPIRRRLTALVLTILAHLLLLLMLVRLAPKTFLPMGKNGSRLSTFDISNDTREPAPRAATKAPAARKSQPKSASASAPVQPPPPVTPPVTTKPAQLDIMRLSEADMNTLDHAMQQSHDKGDQSSQQSADAGSNASGNGDTPSSMGPNGQKLYAAEWVREPTHQELAFYLPKNNFASEGYGEIACRTVPRFHVEDCEVLGDSPQGSGLGRAIQSAAWQFLVRPPRVGGKTLVGEWVRIRITFSEKYRER